MLNKTRIMMTALALVGLSLSATDLAAQHKQASYSKSFGDKWLGGSIYVGGTMTISPRSVYGGFGAEAKAKILCKNLSIAAIRVSASTNKSNGTGGQLCVSLGGKTRFHRQTTKTVKLAYSKPDLRLAGTNKTFWLGPVPVNVSAKVGLGAKASADLTIKNAKRIGVSGLGEAWAYASASGGVGMKFASAGVSCTGKLGKNSLRSSMGAGFDSGFSGRVTYAMTAISTKLQIYAKLLGKTWKKTLASWSSSSFTRTLLSF